VAAQGFSHYRWDQRKYSIYYVEDNKKTTEPQIVTQLSQNPLKVFDCPMFQFSFGFDERLGKMQLAKKT
jgi:hypothetical protein